MTDNHHAREVAEHATSFPCPIFVSSRWPLWEAKVSPIEHIAPDLLGVGEFLLVLHKDDILPKYYAIYAALLGRASIAFANEVYVLFHVRSAQHERNHVKSLHIKAALASQTNPEPLPVVSRSTHFCTYIGDDTLLTETYFGRKIYVASNDISISPHLAYDGRWEQHVTDFIIANLRPGEVFFDIGANCGFYTILAAHLVGRGGFVVAVEPQKKLAGLIRKSLAINGFDRFSTVENSAIAEQSGEMALSCAGDYMGSASLISFDAQETHSETVPVQPLDTVVSRISEAHGRAITPQMIKIDVEGFERAVWRGAKGVFERSGPLIVIMEFSPDRYRQLDIDPIAFLEEIGASGFAINELQADGRAVALHPNEYLRIVDKDDFTDLVLVK